MKDIRLLIMQIDLKLDKIYIEISGNHPIKDELLTKNEIVIANVIKAIFLSNFMYLIADFCLSSL